MKRTAGKPPISEDYPKLEKKEQDYLGSSAPFVSPGPSSSVRNVQSPQQFRISRRSFTSLSRRTFIFVLAIFAIGSFQIWQRYASSAVDRQVDPKVAAWQASNSSDGALNLVRLYPKLNVDASTGCINAWEKYGSLQCHRDILSLIFDMGNATEVRIAGLDPLTTAQNICSNTCSASIDQLMRAFDHRSFNRRWCSFDLKSYGREELVYFDRDGLETDPWRLAYQLVYRYQYFCLKSSEQRPQYADLVVDQDDWYTDELELWARWGIVVGLYRSSMDGVFRFLEQTNEKKTLGGYRVADLERQSDGTVHFVDRIVSPRQVGPGDGETDCGTVTQDWLRQRAFDHIAIPNIIDPSTDDFINLQHFYRIMEQAIRRCKGNSSFELLRPHWEQLGWWCGDQPCNDVYEKQRRSMAQRAYHGPRDDDSPLPELRTLIQNGHGSPTALRILYNGIRRLPCSIWFTEEEAMNQIMPDDRSLSDICSYTCLDSIKELQSRYEAALMGIPDNHAALGFWTSAHERLDRMCKIDSTSHCAPGYAALKRAKWLLHSSSPPKNEIIAAFAAAVDVLEGNTSPVSSTNRSYSIFNTCVRHLLVGWPRAGTLHLPNIGERIHEFLDDPDVDNRTYVKLVKKFFRLEYDMYDDDYSRFASEGVSKEEFWTTQWENFGFKQFE